MSDTTPNQSPSTSPAHAITWPIVALQLVKEMPYLAMTMGGAIVSVVLIMHDQGTSFERLGAAVIPAIVSALAKSRPEAGVGTGVVGLLALVMAKKIGL